MAVKHLFLESTVCRGCFQDSCWTRQQISSATCALQTESFLFIDAMLSCLFNVESSIFIASHHKHLSFLCCKYMFSMTFFLILHYKLLQHK